jgi:hypothetical protein
VWSFVAATYSNQTLTVWVNNSNATWNGCDSYGCIDTSNNQKLFIGAVSADGNAPSAPLQGGWQLYYTGAIDDVRVYNRALTSQEIRELYVLERGNILSIETAAMRLRWPTISNVTYQLQWSIDFQNWSNLFSVLGTGGETNFVDWVVDPRRFYRLITIP